MGVSRRAELHFSPRLSPPLPACPPGVWGGCGRWGCWRVEGPLRGQGALNRPPPALAADVGGAGQLGTAARAFFFWEIAPSPFYRRDTWGPEKNTTGQNHSPTPVRTFPIWGLEGHSFLSGWVPAAERQGRLSHSGCQPPVWSVGAQAPAAKMAGFLQQ